MDEQLERLIVADEDARAHVTAARMAAADRIEAARADCRQRAAESAMERRRALDDELQQIQKTADEVVAARRSARARYAEARRRAAEPMLAEAAGVYARILRGDASPRRIP